jgi:hypothetical protein
MKFISYFLTWIRISMNFGAFPELFEYNQNNSKRKRINKAMFWPEAVTQLGWWPHSCLTAQGRSLANPAMQCTRVHTRCWRHAQSVGGGVAALRMTRCGRWGSMSMSVLWRRCRATFRRQGLTHKMCRWRRAEDSWRGDAHDREGNHGGRRCLGDMLQLEEKGV